MYTSIKHLRNLRKIALQRQQLSLPAQISSKHYAIAHTIVKASPALCIKPNPAALYFSMYSRTLRQQSQTETASEKFSGSFKKNNIEQIMVKLDSFYQLNGYVGPEQLQPVLELLKTDGDLNLSMEQGLFLLNLSGCEMPSVSSEERFKNFQSIWQYLKDRNMLAKDHYNAKLQILQYNRAPLEDFIGFLKDYEKLGGSRNEILSELLAVAGSNGNVKQTTEILSEMRTLQLALTEKDFNSLILAHARAKDLNGCQTVCDSMQAAGLTATSEIQSTLIMAFMENNEMTKASALLQKYHGQFEPHQVLKMLQSVGLADGITTDFLEQLVKELKPDYVKGSELPLDLRRICVELLHDDKLKYLLTIIDTLPAPNFQENQDIDTYAVFLLHALFRANIEIPKIIKISQSLEDTNKNTRALYIAAEIALRRSPPMALPIFEAMQARDYKLRVHYFWPLMMYNFRRHNEAGILRTLKIMRDFKIECDTQTISQYVLPRLSLILTDPQMALQQLDECGVKTSLVMTPIVSHMLTQNKWFDVTALVNAYTTKINANELISPLCSVAIHVRATKRFHHFAKLLNALANKNVDRKLDFVGQFLIQLLTTQSKMRNDPRSLQHLLGEMHKVGIKISPAALSNINSLLNEANAEAEQSENEQMQQKLREMTQKSLSLGNTSDDGSNVVSSFIKHPRDMSLDELECHLVELEAKQMNARGVLRRLLQLSVRDNRLQRALEIKQKCDALQVQTSPGMLASVFELYIKMKDLSMAEQSLKKLQQTYPGFQIDEHKFVDFAALLVHKGQLDKAKIILEERSLKQKIIGGDYILKNIWNLLTNVAQQAASTKDLPHDRNLTRETYAFLQKKGYCRTHNTILGPIVRERLLRGDLPAAIMEFKQLAQQYKHTPLQFELLTLLVRLCNGNDELFQKYNCNAEQAQQFLNEVIETITKIHGPINMNSGLLLAFAESGTDNQLRRLLINPEFRINEDAMLRNCEHLGEEGAVTTLLRLARGTRGLNRVINEQNIYNMLLSRFVKSNDYEAALNLYERLESDEDLKMSQDFLRNLVNLLKVNNIEIPSNIALRAHHVV